MPPVGFEPTISAGERPQIFALDRAATATDSFPASRAIIHAVHHSQVHFSYSWVI